MITIKNVKTLGGEVIDHEIPSIKDDELDAKEKLLLFPGIIDPHISFGSIKSQNFNLAVESAVKGGITTAIEVPNDQSYHTSIDLEQKNKKIKNILLDLQIPLNYFNYLICSESNIEEIDQLGKQKQWIKGIVIHPDEEKKEILGDHWESLFRLAAQEDVPIVINAENENSKKWASVKKGESLLEKAISHTEKFSNRLYVLNVSTKKEINLIQEAKKRALLVYAETTPQHLFSDDLSRTNDLWEALNNQVIETIGSGYDANHQGEEKVLYKKENVSIANPILFLPFLLSALNEKKITLNQLARFTSHHIRDILELDRTQDFVLIDLEKEETIQRHHSQHPNVLLKGWPVYTIIDGHIISAK